MSKKMFSIVIIAVFFNLCFIPLIESEDIAIDTFESKSKEIIGFKLNFIGRRFFLYKQPDISPPENGYPVLFVFHGAVQHAFSWFLPLNPWNVEQNMFLRDAIDKGYLVVAPDSIRPYIIGPRAWDSFTKDVSENKDLQFILDIIDWLNNSNLPVDVNNVFGAGFSSGGFMCSRIGYCLGSNFNALAVHSGVNAESVKITLLGPVFDCESDLNLPSNHPPTVIIHGEKDPIVPMNCAIHFYNELLRHEIPAEILIDSDGEHIWLSDFNDEILDWFDGFYV